MIRKMTRKKKTFATSKRQQRIIDIRNYGDEPIFDEGHALTKREKSTAYNWYNYMCNRDDARTYLDTYFKSVGRDADIKKLESIPDTFIPTTVGWIARLLNRGYDVGEQSIEFMNNRIEQEFDKMNPEKKKRKKKDAPSVQDHIREKVSDFIGNIEEKIDRGEDFSMYEELTISQFPSSLAKKVADYYRPEMDELYELTQKNVDSKLNEGYGHLNKVQKKELYEKFSSIVLDADRYSGNAKKTRKPRKKKIIPADKKVSKLNYLKEHNGLKLHSISPISIIGASSLWAYNTKTKKLTVFHASGPSGLSVKGSTIIDFNEDTSETKTIGRIETKTLTKVIDGGKIILRRLMSEVKAKSIIVNGRINKDTILLRKG